MKKSFFYLTASLPLILICASCASLATSGPATQKNAAEEAARTPREAAPLASAPGTPAAGTDESAASLETAFDSGHWVTRPSGSEITIIGITGRRANRDEAIREAVADAAHKAALYHGVRAASAATLSQGSGSLDYFSGFDYDLSPVNSHEDYIDALVFDEETDILEKNGVVIVRTRYSGVTGVPAYESGSEDGVPVWVKNYAVEIPGFLAGIGLSRNKGSLQKTHKASYEIALVSLLPLLSSRIESEVTGAGGAALSNSVTRSEGELVNVMILETWLDRKSASVWTLLAAKAKDPPPSASDQL
ncbi:MAG: hypothetical protein LBO04_06665 [Spirochaetaceae bacterium]|jgi:hypothetical protein|nr:hypothetical protein [Spirochaetaceae bacterium]